VVRDPNGPKWHKTLVGDPTGAPVIAQPGQIFSLSESLYIEGNLPWMDWHEEILTPGWDWVNPILFLANGVPASGLTVTNTPGSLTQGGTLGFDFDPLYPGTQINIRKQLQYNGPAGMVFIGHISIDQYPTPEPATAGLLALGALPLLRRRRTL
jgi:MYXO-CTERM domain-containing protein